MLPGQTSLLPRLRDVLPDRLLLLHKHACAATRMQLLRRGAVPKPSEGRCSRLCGSESVVTALPERLVLSLRQGLLRAASRGGQVLAITPGLRSTRAGKRAFRVGAAKRLDYVPAESALEL